MVAAGCCIALATLALPLPLALTALGVTPLGGARAAFVPPPGAPCQTRSTSQMAQTWDQRLDGAGSPRTSIHSLVAHGDGGDINPAPLLSLTNDSVIMMWRGGDHWYDIHLAQASNWSAGPYKSQMKGSVLSNIDTRQHGVEDPYLYRQPWPDQTGGFSYHAIFHDHSTFGGHAFSEDGLRWTYRLRDIIVTIRTLD
jgi:hypothetical protein